MNHGYPDLVGQEFKGTGNHTEADGSPRVPEELAWAGGRGAWLLGCSTEAVYGRTKYFREVLEPTKMPPSPRVCCR